MGKKVYIQYRTTLWYMTLLLMQKNENENEKYDIYIFFLFIGETIS